MLDDVAEDVAGTDRRQLVVIADALKRRPSIATPEELFDEIYRGAQAGVAGGAA